MTLNLIIEYLPYLMVGVGVGYLVTLGMPNGATAADHARDELEATKAWIKMQGEKNVRRN